jgi:hypothetical protein
MKTMDMKKFQGDEEEAEAGTLLVGKKRNDKSKSFGNQSFA